MNDIEQRVLGEISNQIQFILEEPYVAPLIKTNKLIGLGLGLLAQLVVASNRIATALESELAAKADDAERQRLESLYNR